MTEFAATVTGQCTLCGAPSTRGESAELPGEPEFLRCPDCGLVSLAVFPVAQEREAGYQEDYYDADQGERFVGGAEALVKFFRWLRLRDLRRVRVPIRSFLDVGCGRGLLLDLFQRHGWKAAGTQLSRTAAAAAQRRGLDVRVGELAALNFAGDSLGLVVFYHVLEHVADPRGYLEETCRVLAAGGVVVAEVPNYDSLGFRILGRRNVCVDYPHHLYFFTPATLRRHFEAVGLVVEGESHFSLEYSPITALQNFLNLLPGRPNRFLDAVRKTGDGSRLRREPLTWLHALIALAAGPVVLLASALGGVLRRGNTYRVYARKPGG